MYTQTIKIYHCASEICIIYVNQNRRKEFHLLLTLGSLSVPVTAPTQSFQGPAYFLLYPVELTQPQASLYLMQMHS